MKTKEAMTTKDLVYDVLQAKQEIEHIIEEVKKCKHISIGYLELNKCFGQIPIDVYKEACQLLDIEYTENKLYNEEGFYLSANLLILETMSRGCKVYLFSAHYYDSEGGHDE